MKAKWIYENNTFLILATRSQKRFYKFMFSFMQALYAEHTIADINTIYTTLCLPTRPTKTGISTGKPNTVFAKATRLRKTSCLN